MINASDVLTPGQLSAAVVSIVGGSFALNAVLIRWTARDTNRRIASLERALTSETGLLVRVGQLETINRERERQEERLRPQDVGRMLPL